MTNILHIETTRKKRAYVPSEEIHGFVAWRQDSPPKEMRLRLLWHSEGTGDQDIGLEKEIIFDSPQKNEKKIFCFIAPTLPHSFSGQQVSFKWILELIAKPSGDFQRLDLIVSPTRKELSAIRDQKSAN